MEVSITDVEYFLNEFKFKLGFWGLIYRSDRDKNKRTLLELDFDVSKLRKTIENLEIEDYIEGPVDDICTVFLRCGFLENKSKVKKFISKYLWVMRMIRYFAFRFILLNLL